MSTKRIRFYSELGSARDIMTFAMREYDGDMPTVGDKIPEHWLGRVDAALAALKEAGYQIVKTNE